MDLKKDLMKIKDEERGKIMQSISKVQLDSTIGFAMKTQLISPSSIAEI